MSSSPCLRKRECTRHLPIALAVSCRILFALHIVLSSYRPSHFPSPIACSSSLVAHRSWRIASNPSPYHPFLNPIVHCSKPIAQSSIAQSVIAPNPSLITYRSSPASSNPSLIAHRPIIHSSIAHQSSLYTHRPITQSQSLIAPKPSLNHPSLDHPSLITHCLYHIAISPFDQRPSTSNFNLPTILVC